MKIQYLSILLVTALAGCNNTQNPNLRKTDLKILAPTGAPAVAMYNFVNGLTSVTSPQDELMPKFNTDEYDIIVAPAKGGLTKITKQGVNYQLAAVVTFGNFGLVKVNPDDEELSEGDKVLFFQPTDIPGSVFGYLYGDFNLDTYSVDNAAQTATPLNTGKYKIDEFNTVDLDYVFSAEPMITNNGKASQIVRWASSDFETKSHGKRIIQAGVFINKNLEKAKADKFLNLLEDDITKGTTNPKAFVNTMKLVGDENEQKHKFGYTSTTVYNCMKDRNGLGIGFARASECKQEIEYFVNDILNSGLTITDEAYYQ